MVSETPRALRLLPNLLCLLASVSSASAKASCYDGKDAYCAKCDYDSQNSKCLECWQSYFDGQNCRSPETKVDKCVQYSSDGKCAKCQDYHFISDNACLQISLVGCKQTDPGDANNCILCEEVVVPDGRCDRTQSCANERCQSCLVTDSGESCLACKEGFQLVAGKPNDCVAVGEATSGCQSVDDESKCLSCRFGYFVSNLHLEQIKCQKSALYEKSYMVVVANAVILILLWATK